MKKKTDDVDDRRSWIEVGVVVAGVIAGASAFSWSLQLFGSMLVSIALGIFVLLIVPYVLMGLVFIIIYICDKSSGPLQGHHTEYFDDE